MYEVFEHTADLGLRVRAATVDALFAEAAKGFFSLIVTNLDAVQRVQLKTYDLAEEELDYLLFDWLNELLYTFDTERLLLAEFRVHVSGGSLSAECRGEALDMERHALAHEIKAITYHSLMVAKESGGWLAELIVDI